MKSVNQTAQRGNGWSEADQVWQVLDQEVFEDQLRSVLVKIQELALDLELKFSSSLANF